MLCSVIPYTRSIDDRLVTYHLPDDFKSYISIGSSVYIPWGKECIIGIVANIAVEIPYEGTLKSIERPHCSAPLLSASEIALIVNLARKLFVRIHTIAQLFLPLGIFDLLEQKNFLDITPPYVIDKKGGIIEYILASDTEVLVDFLQSSLLKNSGAVIVPEGLSVQWWSHQCHREAIIDPHPKSLARQKNIYLEILAGEKDTLFGTRRTLLKRLGHFRHIYIVHENLSQYVVLGLRRIPLWILLEGLAEHGHIIHYISTTPSIRTITHFLQDKKSIQYLEK